MNEPDPYQKQKDKASKIDKTSDIMIKLTEYINVWNKGRNKNSINLQEINECFMENNINYCYFKNHKRKDFVQLLRRYNIKISAAINLWTAFIEGSCLNLLNNKNIINMIESTKWHRIRVRNINKMKPIKTTLSINKADFVLNISDFNKNRINLIPINNNSEYAWIVRMCDNVDIGISLQFINNQCIVNEIYLDKQDIGDKLVISHGKHDCLDSFVSDIDELIIMDGDDEIDDEEESINLEMDWEQWRIDETEDDLDEKVDDMDDTYIISRVQQ